MKNADYRVSFATTIKFAAEYIKCQKDFEIYCNPIEDCREIGHVKKRWGILVDSYYKANTKMADKSIIAAAELLEDMKH